MTPELSDPVGSLEVGQQEDVEQLGAWPLGMALKRLQQQTDFVPG